MTGLRALWRSACQDLMRRQGRGEDQKDHQMCVWMATVGDGIINEDGENRRKSSLEEKDIRFGFGYAECSWRAAWMPQSDRPSFASQFYYQLAATLGNLLNLAEPKFPRMQKISLAIFILQGYCNRNYS